MMSQTSLKQSATAMCLALIFFVQSVRTVPVISNDQDDSDVIDVLPNSVNSSTFSANADAIDLSFFGKAIFGKPDEATAQLVAQYTPDALVNPEELGSYLEGDILIPHDSDDDVMTKNGVTTSTSRWPNGIVPYEIRGNFNARDMATIESTIDEYHRRTCIRFVPRTHEQDYISIVSGNSGCWSSVGRVGGRQEVNLQSPGCLSKPGTPLHELMHALGFLHEQNRQERDAFVSIQYKNVQPSAMSNFEKADRTIAFGVPYDYTSVMHYSANAFSNNGRPTIIATQSGAASKMGQREGFSAMDVEKLNKMYDCGYGSVPQTAPAVVPSGAPGAPPFVAPGAVPPAAGNNIVSNFLTGLISGLGLNEAEETD